jgi:hypothetical protein
MTTRDLTFFAVSSVAALALATAAVAAPPDAPVAYVVKPGDTLIGLAASYLTKPSDYLAVQKANQIARPRHLKIGSRLLIDPNLLKSTPIDARLSAVSGPVELETAGQRAPARAGMLLVEGQRLHTGEGAFATFEMADDSRVTLPSNTSLRIDRMRQTILNNAPQRVFQMDKGRGTISATPNSNPNAKFEVRTPVSISAVRGTEFRVGQDPSGAKAQTEVLKGAVGVDLAPKLGDGGQRQGDKTVHFTVQPIDKAAAYRLAVSRDAGFVDIFAESTTPEPAVDFGAVPNGTYFVRLTALDGGGLEGLPADYSFDRDLDILEPGAAPSAQASGKHRNFLFRWSAAGDGVRVFRFQLFAGDDETKPIIDQPGLSEPQLTLTDLPPGTYGWRVSAVRFKAGTYSEKVGPMQTLQIGR